MWQDPFSDGQKRIRILPVTLRRLPAFGIKKPCCLERTARLWVDHPDQGVGVLVTAPVVGLASAVGVPVAVPAPGVSVALAGAVPVATCGQV